MKPIRIEARLSVLNLAKNRQAVTCVGMSACGSREGNKIVLLDNTVHKQRPSGIDGDGLAGEDGGRI